MKKSIMIIALALVSLSVYAQHENHDMQKKDNNQEIATYETDTKFQDQLAALYESSLALTEAFVSSDPAVVTKKAEIVELALKKIDMTLLKGKAHMDWMKYRKEIMSSIAIFKSEEKITDQRIAYADFSNSLYRSVKAFGMNGKEAYYQHCPMALNNTGAYWLSDKAEIRNPYFGNAMMKCGSTKEKIHD